MQTRAQTRAQTKKQQAAATNQQANDAVFAAGTPAQGNMSGGIGTKEIIPAIETGGTLAVTSGTLKQTPVTNAAGTPTQGTVSGDTGTKQITPSFETAGPMVLTIGTPKQTSVNNAKPETTAYGFQMPPTPPKSPDGLIATSDNGNHVQTDLTPLRPVGRGTRVTAVKSTPPDDSRPPVVLVVINYDKEKPPHFLTTEPVVSTVAEDVVSTITKPIVLTAKKRGHDDTDEAEAVDGVVTQSNKRVAYPGAGHIDFSDPMFTNLLIFAKRRQALCESIPWYHSYNSSLYSKDLNAYGLMVDEDCVVNAQVVITTVGGGRQTIHNKKTNTTVNKRVVDQSAKTAIYLALENSMKQKLLVGVIAGKKHPRFTGHQERYMVLDFFHITEIWSQKCNDAKGKREFRVRLEKANLNTASWWDLDHSHYQLPGAIVEKKTCTTCKTTSKHIFKAGWTCLNSTCTEFYKDATGEIIHSYGYTDTDANGNKIQSNPYNDAFLNERQGYSGSVPSIIPEEPETEDKHGSEPELRAGRVCPLCYCCSSRKFWLGWSCENCGWEQPLKMEEYPKPELQKDEQLFARTVNGMRNRNNLLVVDNFVFTKVDSHLDYRHVLFGQYQVAQVLLPDPLGNIIGSVTVFQANDAIRRRGPDELFKELSTADIGLQRNVVSAGGSGCEGWTRHFGQNWGAQYKFGVKVQSKPFSEAPDCILKSYKRMDFLGHVGVRSAKQFVESGNAEGAPEDEIHNMPDLKFNELLSLGYMQGDKINYHDDGEKTVGPTVASLSLGSPAMMKFRPKAKSGMGLDIVDLKNCPKKIKNGQVVNAETVEEQPADQNDILDDKIIEEGTLPKKALGLYGDVLQFELRHGDVLVMHGSEIHKYYEHAVEPSGGRRFALTCRYIVPEKIKDKELRAAAPINGTLPARAAEFAYNGDLDLGYLNDGVNRGPRI